jgi:hypothetical protein
VSDEVKEGDCNLFAGFILVAMELEKTQNEQEKKRSHCSLTSTAMLAGTHIV